jgi:RNA polymerase sporulation-specific sigma factor
LLESVTNEIEKAQNGDKEAMAVLVEENQGLIWSIVKRFTGRGYDIEDIYQIGAMGFIKSIRNFDVNFDVKLSTYAVPYILGEIKRFLRDDGPIKVSRSLKDLYRKIVEVQKEYLIRNEREPTLRRNIKNFKSTKRRDNTSIRSKNTNKFSRRKFIFR